MGRHDVDVTFTVTPCANAGDGLLHKSWSECGDCRYFTEYYSGHGWKTIHKDIHDRLDGFVERTADGIRSTARVLQGTYLRVYVSWIATDGEGQDEVISLPAEAVFVVDPAADTRSFLVSPGSAGSPHADGEGGHVMVTVSGKVRLPTDEETRLLQLRDPFS